MGLVITLCWFFWWHLSVFNWGLWCYQAFDSLLLQQKCEVIDFGAAIQILQLFQSWKVLTTLRMIFYAIVSAIYT